jgi:precorrin-4/cobalt-precorrin-4 C11-methyltransferase
LRQILTRYGDSSPMPAGEQLADLARHGSTLAIHLGIKNLARIVEELLPYGADCPIAVVHRATWPDQDWARAPWRTSSRRGQQGLPAHG